jgi:hypothetical protein
MKPPVTLHVISESCKEVKERKGSNMLRGVTVKGQVKRGEEVLHTEGYVLEPGDSVTDLQRMVGLEMKFWAERNTE